MRSEYKRDMNHNYLILTGEDTINTDSYQVRMIVANVVPDLLQCRIQGIDGKFMVYYDVTSRHSMTTLFENRKRTSGNSWRFYSGDGSDVGISSESLSADPGAGIYLSGCGKEQCSLLLYARISWRDTGAVSESCRISSSKTGS